MGSRIAIVFGATGLVGNLLLEELEKTENYKTIRIFVRQTAGISSPVFEEIINDFSNIKGLGADVKGDDLFICLGTTIKKAGTVENMEKIDRDLTAGIAILSQKNGVKRVAVVSSIGADPSSKNYYLRIKGEMEQGILAAGFEKTVIVRPSMLMGERKERRPGEIAGKVVMTVIKPVLSGKLLKFRAIHGRDVARAMIMLLDKETDKKIFESDELQKIVKS
jgi:Predicted nucleoside-diphosphate-sugar epimerases